MLTLIKENKAPIIAFFALVGIAWLIGKWIPDNAPFLPEVEYAEPAPYVSLERFDAWAKAADAKLDEAIKVCTPPKAQKKAKK